MSTTDKTTLVSLFHTQAEATKAMSDLQAAGVPTQYIQRLGGASGSTLSPEAALAALQSLDLPAKDNKILSDGVKSGGTVIVVRAEKAIADKAEDVFESHHARQIDERTVGIPTQPTAGATAVAGETAIPIVEEQLVVGKRKVEQGGIRVFSHMVAVPVEEKVVLKEEHARVERHAVNRPISSAEIDALQDRSIEVQESAEEAVVGKTARVVEEVHVGKETTERNQQIHDTVRKTQVEVDEITGESVRSTMPKK